MVISKQAILKTSHALMRLSTFALFTGLFVASGAIADSSRLKVSQATDILIPLENRPNPSVCDRSEGARRNIMFHLSVQHCSQVTKRMLREITWFEGRREMTQIRSGDFNDFVNLVALKLNQLKIETIDEDVFKDMRKLMLLELQDNQLQFLPMRLFWPLVNLGKLDLFSNKLRTLDPEAFRMNKSLFILDLSVNWHLIKIDSRQFRGLFKLQHLNLGNTNLIEVADDLFSDLDNLKELNLFNNHLDESIFPKIANLKNLERLSFHENNISSLHARDLKGLESLGNLTIGGPKFEFIEDQAFVGTRVSFVNVDASPLTRTSRAAFVGVDRVGNLPSDFGVAKDVGGGTWD